MAKKFIRGTFELDKDVTDLVVYEEKIVNDLKYYIDWAESNGVYLCFGCSDDNYYLCEFEVKANTLKMCKGYVAELKSLLKKTFPKARVIFQADGNILW